MHTEHYNQAKVKIKHQALTLTAYKTITLQPTIIKQVLMTTTEIILPSDAVKS